MLWHMTVYIPCKTFEAFVNLLILSFGTLDVSLLLYKCIILCWMLKMGPNCKIPICTLPKMKQFSDSPSSSSHYKNGTYCEFQIQAFPCFRHSLIWGFGSISSLKTMAVQSYESAVDSWDKLKKFTLSCGTCHIVVIIWNFFQAVWLNLKASFFYFKCPLDREH